MKHRFFASISLLLILLYNSQSLYAQRIYELENFLNNVRIKRQNDLASLGCHSFSVQQEQIIREDTITTTINLLGREYHKSDQPLVRIYQSLWINRHPVDSLPDADTLFTHQPLPSFYDENFHQYYQIKDLGLVDLNGHEMRQIEFIPQPRYRNHNFLQGKAWIDPKTYGIIKMTLEPFPLPQGITKMTLEIYNTVDKEGRVIRYGMKSLTHINTLDRQMEIQVIECYSEYQTEKSALCDTLTGRYSFSF
ncbi:MAG: hypothetical protein PHE86_02645 [Candidatus Marinimicrobia bacterium]|nr:hypothetical protein [Candidatus Neomarinimicrobiota bacterium]MDD5582074.1 hypothetical protein [Candidatus Neomarinimicrobiota bacterium]